MWERAGGADGGRCLGAAFAQACPGMRRQGMRDASGGMRVHSGQTGPWGALDSTLGNWIGSLSSWRAPEGSAAD